MEWPLILDTTEGRLDIHLRLNACLEQTIVSYLPNHGVGRHIMALSSILCPVVLSIPGLHHWCSDVEMVGKITVLVKALLWLCRLIPDQQTYVSAHV
jgi:hypothetical protein